MFNWSMSYRLNSDIPVPYGRTIRLAKPLDFIKVPGFDRKNLVGILAKNCGANNRRWEYVKQLKNILGK